ncbi:MAG: class I SAM-dependent RNA methyltransferase [Bacillota bacterium]|nr:class I SAM-dependent RNA methyltransferase [Bacillota bacterium]
MQIVLPVIMGLERVVAAELQELGHGDADITLADAEVRLRAPTDRSALSRTIARLNLRLACAERVLLELDQAQLRSFDDLVAWIEGLPWEDWVPESAEIRVGGYALDSVLHSVPDIQRLIKRGIVERLLERRYGGRARMVPERREQGRILVRFALRNDCCSLRVDTSGTGLHKRGYRSEAMAAPLKETLAAALVRLLHWPARPPAELDPGCPWEAESLYDPYCGSGTIVIEAALRAAGAAPGRLRRFAGEKWGWLDQAAFAHERRLAREEADAGIARIRAGQATGGALILGSDIDTDSLAIAGRNAGRAGVGELCSFFAQDALRLDRGRLAAVCRTPRCLLISNIPYGERLEDAEAAAGHARALGRLALQNPETGELAPGLRLGILALARDFERNFGRPADRRRKLYNGSLACTYYQYLRPRPPAGGRAPVNRREKRGEARR